MLRITRFRTASTAMLLSLAAAWATSPEDFIETPPPAKTAAVKPDAAANPAGQSAAQPVVKAAPAKAAADKTPAPLDTAKIHLTYLDGDFDQAIKALETQLKSKRPMSHAESVFVFKHLGVMYAANPATREKGKYYMYQLINIEPTAKILDMYASDMIHLIYRNVQEDYEMKRSKSARLYDPSPAAASAPVPAAPASPPAPAPAPESRASSPSRKAYWVTGGAVLAVGTAGLLYVLLGDSQPKTHTIHAVE